ncbi:MAG: glycosyltransferase family 39 protein [Candidatus Daviesbacteria bacterium]|nr:glycosyltransferase family 39 protein [Candidatus Daviesbacteria bacterium]
MKFSSINLFLALIVFLFLFTRFFKLSEIPPSVYWDEASIGYNAYSIAETGKDEWGEFLPIHFRAFGEFKLPVYIYVTAASVKVFGLNEFSVRLPAVLFSLGTVFLIFFLARKLSDNATVGLLSSFFMTVSPWFFIFSRTGYEATAGLMFYVLAIYLFLQNNRNLWYIFFSILSFILCAYSYNSFRIVVPLTILILVAHSLRNPIDTFKKGILPLALSVIFLALSAVPIYRLYVYDAGVSRLQAVSTTSSTFIQNYLSHFNPNFLFLRGDKNLRSQQTGFGQLYFPDLLLLTLGVWYITVSKSKYKILLFALLLLGFIPAAITKEAPHALRTISVVPFLSIISALGVVQFWQWVKNRKLFNLIVVIIFLIFFSNYFFSFLNTYPVESSKDWQYGYKKIFTDYKNNFDKYDQVIISDEYAQPYIFALFYLKIDSNKFRQSVVRNNVDQWGFSTVSSFDKFEFGKIDKLLNKDSKNTLIFASAKELLPDLNPSEIINFLDGEIAFRMYKLK